MKHPGSPGYRAVLVVFVLAGCASSGQAPAAGPTTARPVAPAATAAATPQATAPGRFSLEPSEGAQRVADRVTLTGRELGTMWTFENPPLDYWKKQYNFTATPDWLEHVRLSSVRFGEICSASFVSPDGLVMTNHHCARECVEANSSPGSDYVVKGFQAKTRQEERLCPDLFLDQLVAIEDVTARVQAASPAGGSDTQIAESIQRATQQIEAECKARTSNTCQVVSLFQGGQYQLYQYKRWQPVKLVFAPELQAGFFGGDPDNFTYPRYDLDVSFVRAYASDGSTPARTPQYFRFRPEGAREGETVFVTGNPGSTSRLITMSQLMYERVYRHPFLIQLLSAQRDMLESYARANPQAETEIRQELFEVENSLKAYRGELEGLRDTLLAGTKLRWEREFRDRVKAAAQLTAQYGDVWNRLEDIQKDKLAVSPRLNMSNLQLVGAPELVYASELVSWVREMAKPEAQRSNSFRGANAQQMQGQLEAAQPIDPQFAWSTLQRQLELAHSWLTPEDPFYNMLFKPDESVDEATQRLSGSTHILDAAFRKQIMQGGPAALDAATDPLVALARDAAAMNAQLTEKWRTVQAAETVQKQRLAKALFAVYGTSLPPDATFTLRISDGRIERYAYNGTFAPPFTTFYGMWARSVEFGNAMPWTLPTAFSRATKSVDMTTPLDFVSTTDITGGNSGSPMIDEQGRVVGLVFDGNIEQLPNEFLFRSETGRTVAVHAAGIVEALRNIDGADALLRELLGQGPAGGRE